MAALKLVCRALGLVAFAMLLSPVAKAQALYPQTIRAALLHHYPGLELYLFDLRTHQPILDTFAPAAIPVGSLLKPFVAEAYAQTHTSFPTIVCHGHLDRCWKPHGSITLTPAIAQSCNAYFLALARELTPASFARIAPPPANATPEALMGLTAEWRLTPKEVTEAYAALFASPSAAQHAILEGMRGSASHGTAARIGPHRGGVLAKTGTAPCVAGCTATGDGLVLAAVPAAQPTLILLVRKRGTTGASTAAAAGPVLTRLEALHAY